MIFKLQIFLSINSKLCGFTFDLKSFNFEIRGFRIIFWTASSPNLILNQNILSGVDLFQLIPISDYGFLRLLFVDLVLHQQLS